MGGSRASDLLPALATLVAASRASGGSAIRCRRFTRIDTEFFATRAVLRNLRKMISVPRSSLLT
jgi:hypothetical protein